MRRSLGRLLIPVVLILLACRALTPAVLAPPQISVTPAAATLGVTPSPDIVASPTPLPPTLTPLPIPDKPFDVRVHPDGPLYVGDQVSLEIIAPPQTDLSGHSVEVQVDAPQGSFLATVDFGRYGIGGRSQATLMWAWDTSNLEAGEHTLTFKIKPDGPTWTQNIRLHPQDEVPPPEPQAKWASVDSKYCRLYYITGTAAERDIQKLMAMVDEQAQDVSQRLGVEINSPIPIVFLPRVLGHGGFTGQEISVSYLDRNYAGSDSALVLHHEMVHLLDNRLGGDLRPTILLEGLAVYLSGGHFKKDPLLPRAAALLSTTAGCAADASSGGSETALVSGKACGLGTYLPLKPLIDEFYTSQHEIGYLEAGALVEYMVNTWGWQAFSDFYRDIHSVSSGSQAQAMENALRKHFNISLDDLEQGFLSVLREQTVTSVITKDVSLTVLYYDTVRRYQQLLDPSAYFLTAWLPDAVKMRQKGIVADYLRHPSTPENIALETLLVSADNSLLSGDYARTEQTLAAVNAMLDIFSGGGLQTYGQGNRTLNGGWQYKFIWSKTIAPTTRTHSTTSRHPQPAYSQVRDLCLSSSSSIR